MRQLWMIGGAILVSACSFDWDRLDPSNAGEGGGAPAAGGGGEGAATGVGAGGSGAAGGGECPEGGIGPIGDVFGAPELVTELDGPHSDDDPFFTADLRELYFNSNRDGEPFQIYRTTRACPTDPWGKPEQVANLDLGVESTSPVLSADGLSMYLAYSMDAAVKQFDVYVTTRDAVDAAWSKPTIVTELSSPETDRVSWISDDGLIVVLDSLRSGNADLFVARREGEELPWETPVPLDELNSPADELAPWLSPDRLTIVFGRDVTGEGTELFRATRSSLTEAFGAVEAVSELNTSASESDPRLSPDQRFIMFARASSGESHLYQARR